MNRKSNTMDVLPPIEPVDWMEEHLAGLVSTTSAPDRPLGWTEVAAFPRTTHGLRVYGGDRWYAANLDGQQVYRQVDCLDPTMAPTVYWGPEAAVFTWCRSEWERHFVPTFGAVQAARQVLMATAMPCPYVQDNSAFVAASTRIIDAIGGLEHVVKLASAEEWLIPDADEQRDMVEWWLATARQHALPYRLLRRVCNMPTYLAKREDGSEWDSVWMHPDTRALYASTTPGPLQPLGIAL